MSFIVAYSTDGGSNYDTINYQDFAIDYGVSDVLLAPIASVDVARTAGASTGDRLLIQENGTTRFVGRLTTGGKVNRNGQTKLKAEHDIYPVFEDSVSITVSNPTDEDVYNAALSAANGGGGFTLNYQPTPVSLGDDYDVEDRSVKRIFRDMTDRTNRVFFVGVGDTITVGTRGGGGQFASVSAGDSFRVEQYNPGDINTVRNAVTVNGTGAERVTATAEDSTSISDYGRRAETFNYSYIRTATEAQDMADELLVPDPLASGEILLGQSVGSGATDEIVNQTLDFDDPQGSGASDDLTIERQIINPGSVTVNVGEGAGVSVANVNRDSQSQDDQNEPGSVYDSDRIADEAISNQKIQPDAISDIELQNGSVQSLTLADGSVLTTKIGDEQVTADKVTTGTIRGADFERIADGEVVGTQEIINLVADKVVFADQDNLSDLTKSESGATVIEGGRIETESIDASLIDTLDLATNQLEIGTDTNTDIKFTEVDLDTAIIPETDGACQVGDDFDRFSNMFAINMIADAGIFEQLSVDEGTSFEIKSREFANGVGIVPENDNENVIGNDSTNEAFSSMAAHNFITATPKPLSGIDASSILGYSWEQPPQYCAQRKATASDDCEYRYQNPSSGVDIPHMVNYLFEVCKDQQRRIDDLEDRLATLEAQQ